jgi:hypothetical protein
MEHRWGQRVTSDLPVRLKSWPYGIGSGRVCNFSISGAFIETRLRLPLLARVRIELPKHRSRSAQEVDCCVVRSAVGGIAVEWLDLAPAAVAALFEQPARAAEFAEHPSRAIGA